MKMSVLGLLDCYVSNINHKDTLVLQIVTQNKLKWFIVDKNATENTSASSYLTSFYLHQRHMPNYATTGLPTDTFPLLLYWVGVHSVQYTS